MLEGKKINLRIAEKEDVPLLDQWFNDVKIAGDYQHFPLQISKAQLERRVLEQKISETEWVDFIIEKKDGTRIGWAAHYIGAPNFGWIEIATQLFQTKGTRVMEPKSSKSYWTICSSQETSLVSKRLSTERMWLLDGL